MVAAVLDLHVGTGAIAEALDQMAGGHLDRHDVVDQDTLGRFAAQALEGPALGLFLIADDVIDLVHGSEAGRIDLRRAARHHDLGLGALAARLPDRLPRLAHGLCRDRAGVDDHRVVEARGVDMLSHHLRLIGVEPAAEGDDLDIRHSRLLTRNS
jgi:hypothetical protein